jgi:hypothetical protein
MSRVFVFIGANLTSILYIPQRLRAGLNNLAPCGATSGATGTVLPSATELLVAVQLLASRQVLHLNLASQPEAAFQLASAWRLAMALPKAEV